MSLLLLFPNSGASTFTVTSWPDARTAPYPNQLRTHVWPPNLNLLGKDKFFSAPGQGPDYDWPNPKAPVYATSLRTHLVSLNTTTLAPAGVQAPFDQTDWPNPRQPPPFLQRLYGRSLNVSTLAVPVGEASQDIKFATPARVPPQVTQSLALANVPATPFRPQQFPLPVSALYPATLRTRVQNLLETTLAPSGVPFAWMAWTLPKQAPRFTQVTLGAYNIPLNTPVVPPVTVPDCGHLFPSNYKYADLTEAFYTAGILTEAVSVPGSQRSAISKAGSTRSGASKAGSMKPTIPC